MTGGTDRQRTLAETQTAGFGLANGKVVELLIAEFDDDQPAITVRHDRVDHPDPMRDRDVRRTTVETVTVAPTNDIDRRKVEIGTRHGRDRVLIETHDHAPRAYVRHERNDGAWNERAAWELHPVTGISQVSGEAVADGGVEQGTDGDAAPCYHPHVDVVDVAAVDPGPASTGWHRVVGYCTVCESALGVLIHWGGLQAELYEDVDAATLDGLDACRECGRPLAQGYLCDDCDTVEIDREEPA